MTKFTNKGMTNGDVEVTIKTEGPEQDAETVHMHAVDEIAKALEATEERRHPEDCSGHFIKVDWNSRLGLTEEANE